MTKARDCGNKQKHPSKGAAEDHKWSMVRNFGHSPSRLSVYKCPFCKKWHVGHKKTRRR